MDSLEADEDYWLNALGEAERNVHEPYRRKLAIVCPRLQANLERVQAHRRAP